MLSTNDRQDAVEKHVANLDVHEIQAKEMDVSASSKMT